MYCTTCEGGGCLKGTWTKRSPPLDVSCGAAMPPLATMRLASPVLIPVMHKRGGSPRELEKKENKKGIFGDGSLRTSGVIMLSVDLGNNN